MESSPSPPRFFRAPLFTSCATLVSPSLASSPSGSTWASWFSLLSPPSWLLSDFLSLLLSFSLREEGGFFPLLLRTFCCCWREDGHGAISARLCDFGALKSKQQAEIRAAASGKYAKPEVEKSFWTPLIFIFYVLNHFTQSQLFSLNVCQKCFLCFKKCGCIRATQTNRNYFAVYRQKRKLNSRSSLEVLQRTSSELDGTTAHVQHVAQQKLPTALVTHLASASE